MTGDRQRLKQRIVFRSVRFVSARAMTGSLSVLASLLLYRILGPAEAGRFQFVLAAGMTLGVMSGLGFFETLARFVPVRPQREGNGIFRRALRWNVAIGVVFGLLLWGAVRATGFPRDAVRVGVLLPLFMLVYALYTTALGMFRGRGRLEILPVLDLGWNFGAKMIAVLTGLVVPLFVPVFTAYVSMDLVVTGIALFLLRNALRESPTGFHREEVVFARLILLAEVVKILARTVDIYVIRALLGPEATGLFAAGARVTMVVEQVVLTPIGVPFLYYFSHPASSSLRRSVVENGGRLLGSVMGAAALILAWLAGPVVLLLLGEAYRLSIPVARLYTGHVVGASLVIMLIPLYNSKNRPQFGIAQGLLVFTLNLVLDLVLVPRFGVVGAAVAGVIATVVTALVAAWGVHRVFGIDIRGSVVRILGLYLGCFALLVAGWPVLALVIYGLGLWLLRLVRSSDLDLARRPMTD